MLAARGTGLYLVTGLAWVGFSDFYLAGSGDMTPWGLWIAISKGFTYVLLTSGLVFWLIRREAVRNLQASSLLWAIVEGSSDAIFAKDRQGRYILVNSAAARNVGKSVDEVLGLDDRALFDADVAAALMATDQRIMSEGRGETNEVHLTADQAPPIALSSKAPYRDARGEIVGVVGVARDITEARRAERAIRESETRLAEAQRLARLGSWAWDPVANRVWWSDAIYELFGVDRAQVVPSLEAFLAVLHPEDRPRGRARAQRMLDGQVEFADEFRLIRPDGRELWIYSRARVTRDDSGTVIRVEGTDQDITERKHAERKLRLAQFSVDRAVDAMFWITPDGTIEYANEAAGRILGYSSTELIGKTVWEIDSNFPQEIWPAHWEEVKRRGSFSFESAHDTKSGEIIPTEVTVNYLQHEDREYNCAVMRDLRERKRAEAAARQSELRFTTLMENTPTLAWINDEFGRNRTVNSAWQRAFGRSAAEQANQSLEATLQEHPVADYLASDRRVLETGQPWTGVEAGPREDGRPGKYLVTKFSLGAATDGARLIGGVAIDITDRTAAEEAIRASEERLRLALVSGKMGIYDWDLTADRVVWSDTHYELWGYPPGDPREVSFATFIDRVHPDDRAAVKLAVQKARDTQTPYSMEHRVLLPEGEQRWIQATGSFQYDNQGQPIRMLGIVKDITDRKGAELALCESERRYREFGDSIPQIAWTANPQGEMTFLNARTAEYSGLSANYLTGWSWASIIHPDDIERLIQDWTEILKAGVPRELRFRIRRHDGQYRWHIGRQTPHFDDEGQLAGWYGTCVDVEDLEAANAALRASEEQLKLAIRASGVVIWDWDVLRNAQVWRVEGQNCFGWQEALQSPQPVEWWSERVHPDDYHRVVNLFHDVLADPASHNYHDEYRFRRADGSYVDVVDDGYVLRDDSGKAIRAVGALLDVTERKRAEQAIRESEELYRKLVEMLPTAVILQNSAHIVFGNPALLQLLGQGSPDTFRDYGALSIYYPEDRGVVESRLETLANGDDPSPGMEIRLLAADGRTIPVYWVATPVVRNGQTMFIIALSDLSEQQKAHQLLTAVMASVSDAIVTINAVGQITSVNSATESLFGYSPDELLGQNIQILMPESYRVRHSQHVSRFFNSRESDIIGRQREFEGRRKDGTVFPLDLCVTDFQLSGQTHFTGVLRDVSRRKQLEEQLRQSQKMEAIGRLAGGIAHDFNNLLTVINGYSDILITSLATNDLRRSDVRAIRDAGERAAALTSQLLAFGRKSLTSPVVFDLRETAIKADQLIRRLIGEDISLTTLSPEYPCWIRADPNQIDQALLNLVVNSRDAMPHGGRLIIEVHIVTYSEPAAEAGPDPEPTRFCELAVIDTGLGMSAEVQARIFEPFFTTKEAGQGTGLGLATVYGIVEQVGGTIRVESEVGRGAVFRLRFPEATPEQQEPHGDAASAAVIGHETILVVEDNEAVRKLATTALRGQGYPVLEAADGHAALELVSKLGDQIRLLMTDVVMPGMNGPRLVEAVLATHPHIQVLYTSGYTDDEIVRREAGASTHAFLQKPFTPATLAQKVRQLLGERA